MHHDDIVACLLICDTIIIGFKVIVTQCRLVEVYVMLGTAAAAAAAYHRPKTKEKKMEKINKNIYYSIGRA